MTVKFKALVRACVATVAAAVVVLTGLVVPSAAMADDEVTAYLGIEKTASATDVRPGDTFAYHIQVSCSVVGVAGCVGATLTDPVPDAFEIIDVFVPGTHSATFMADGQNVQVTFDEALDDGEIGLVGGATVTVTINVRAREDLSADLSGVAIPNTATFAADNAAPVEATAPVTPTVDRALATTASKSFEPVLGQAAPGATTTLTLGGTNTSNAAVESIALTDPSDPGADGNPFALLAITSIDEVIWPAGATAVAVEYWNGTEWVAGDTTAHPEVPNAPPMDATGIRAIFTGDDGAVIPIGAQAGLVLTLAQRDEVADLDASVTLNNTVESTVTRDGAEATGTADATYRIVAEPIAVSADKSFDPELVFAGGATSVTLGGGNASETGLDTLTLREPASGAFDSRLAFTGFTSAVQFPAGAESGTLTLVYLDADGVEQTFTAALSDGDDFPPLPADVTTLEHFELAFAAASGGEILSGATTTVTFGAIAAEGLDAGTVIDNVVGVDGTAGDQTAHEDAPAELTIDERRVDVATQKRINPGTIWGHAGEVAVVQLPTTLLDSSTTNAQHIVVNDPELDENGVPAASGWWDHFRPTAITRTDVPNGATLTVRYFDTATGEWAVLEGADGIAGPTTFSLPIPDDLRDIIGGFQFDFANEGTGFAPGATVQPNFTAELVEGLAVGDDDLVVENCSSAAASAPGATAGAATVDPCPEIEILAPTPGEYDLIDKEWIDPTPALVSARSGEHATSRLRWSTGGLSGLDQVILADTATDGTAAGGPAEDVENTTYQAFDLVAIKAITPDLDPLIAYDRVVAVELWNGTAWVSATNFAGPYDGSMPAIALTPEEQASTQGVRLLVEEYTAAREAATDPAAPTPGSGVARSLGHDRAVDLEWAIRDTKRAPADGSEPVLGIDEYNAGHPGDVSNTASATGLVDGDPRAHDVDSDIISILDRPLNVGVTKTWAGGPIGIPPAHTPVDQYPSGRVTITATNDTAAKVDTLEVVDPAPGGADPFDVFDLKDIVSISIPSGATESTVILTEEDGDETEYTVAAALALTADDMEDVVSIRVRHDGRVDAGAETTIVMDLRLRSFLRDNGADVTMVYSTVTNETEARVSDVGGTADDDPTAQDDASIRLAELDIDVATTKLFTPATQYEDYLSNEPAYADERWNPVTLSITARPSGSARTALMTVSDTTASFWNAYRFEGFAPGFQLARPIEQVRVDALVGGDYVREGDDLSLDGAHWEEGTFASTPSLPEGVDADDVQGLRFTFQRADGSQWENPANPLQRIDLLVKRRAFQAIDGTTPVPSSAAGNAPSAGEAEAGVFTNTVDAHVESAVNGIGGAPLTADDDSTSQTFYEPGGIEVATEKTPQGLQQPGVTIPFELRVTNTAPADATLAKAILHPVITDHLPQIDGVPQLVFDPERTEPNYEFRYTPTAGDSGANDRMPIDPALIEITEITNDDGDITDIRFEFPDNTVLMPGEVYTITIHMMFRPGIEAGTEITNGFDITSDETFEACNGVEGAVAACGTETTVYPSATGALRGQKYVKADDDELGVNNVADAAAVCEPALDDFYAANCVPVTKPLGTETWREQVTNTGTLAMDRVVTIDRLPTPGDTGAWAPLTRGSQWQPLWVGGFGQVAEDGHRIADDVTLFYSSAEDPCTADLRAGAPCAEGEWLPLSDDVDPALVRHVKTVFDFSSDPFRPGDVLGYTFRTRTPAVSPIATADTVAWNTIAVGALTVDGSGGRIGDVLPVESRRVGVALATGPLSAVKTVTGDAAAYAPDTFQVQAVCTVGAGTELETVLDPVTITVTAGETATFTEQFPWGADCVLEDVAGVNGETSSTSADAVTIGRDDETVPVAELENAYDESALEVSKTVIGATDEDGEAIDYGDFPFSVTCTFLGNDIIADGFDTTPMTFALAEGESRVLEGIPSGSVCIVSETDAKGATATSVVTTADGEVTSGASAAVTTDADAAASVAFTNTFPLGAITLTKQVDGAAAAFVAGDTAFTFDVVCTLDGATVYETTLTLTKAQADAGEVRTIDTLPAGAACAVTETEDGGATATSITPASATVVGAVDQPLAFTAVNTFATGAIAVTKEITGAGADFAAGSFEVTAECTFQGAALVVPGGATRTLNADGDWAASYDGLPVGAACVLSETVTGGATSSTIVDAAGDPVDTIAVADGTVVVRVINTYDLGGIDVVKEIAGDGAAWAADAFEVGLVCTFDGAAIEVPGGAARALTADGDWAAAYEGLPVGAECVLTETVNGGATSSTIVDADGDAVDTITVGAGDAAQVRVVNTYGVGAIAVVKEFDGDGADAWAADTFEVFLECSFLGQTITVPGGATRTLTASGGWAVTYDGLPVGAECALTETETGGATSSAIVDADGDAVDTITVGAGDAAQVRVVNTYDTGSIVVSKEITGAGAEPWAAESFQVTLECTFLGESIVVPGGAIRTLVADDGWAASYAGLPVGAECALTETETGGATSSAIVDAAGDALGTIVIAAGDAAQVRVINTYDVGAIAVTKQVDGAGADAWAPAEFEVLLTCTFRGDEIVIPAGAARTIGAANGWTVVYDGLPVGAECVVTETVTGGATSTVITDADGAPLDGPVVVGAGDAVAVGVVNTFDLGGLSIVKEITGAGAEWAADAFEVQLECTFDGATITVPGGAARALTAEGGWTAAYDGLPVGAECALTETETGDATTSTIVDGAGDPLDSIRVAAGDAAQVRVVNSYDVGGIDVVKEFDGAGAEWAADAFEVLLECSFRGASITVPAGATRALTADGDWTAAYDGLPVGAECVLTETETGGATSTAIRDAAGDPIDTIVVGADARAAVRVVNTYDTGAVLVRKLLAGDGAERWAPAAFDVLLECTFVGDEIVVPGGATRAITAADDWTVVYDGLPVGAECVVTETRTGGATSTEIVTADGDPLDAPIVVDAEEIAEVQVINTFDIGGIVVTKEIAGAGAAKADDREFTVELVCTAEVDGETVELAIPGGAERTLSREAGLTARYDELPADAECTLRETGTGGAAEVEITPNDGEDPVVGVVTIAAGEDADILVVNTFDPDPAPLPATGGNVPVWLIAGGVGLLVVGGILLLVMRRRGRD